ncbi:cyclophilin-like domain-containing protein, partial [Mycena floridula]
MIRPRVFLDFSINNEPAGRVIFELFTDLVPKTSENFRALCTGEKGLSSTGIPLYYKNSIVHRSIKDFMIQGGDFTKRNGTGGESIYGGTFSDEDLSHPLDSEALLCMANRGPNTNGSQFFITLRECPHLNGKHVVFGKVIRGYDDVVQKIVKVSVDEKDRPMVPVMIYNCGELELKKKAPLAKPERTSISEDEGRSLRRRRSRSDSVDSDKPRRHKKKKKSKRSKTTEEEQTNVVRILRPGQTVPETEEEYDARLEREEKEREEARIKSELLHVKDKYEEAPVEGVRFKGRGRMKFVDPDSKY